MFCCFSICFVCLSTMMFLLLRSGLLCLRIYLYTMSRYLCILSPYLLCLCVCYSSDPIRVFVFRLSFFSVSFHFFPRLTGCPGVRVFLLPLFYLVLVPSFSGRPFFPDNALFSSVEAVTCSLGICILLSLPASVSLSVCL